MRISFPYRYNCSSRLSTVQCRIILDGWAEFVAQPNTWDRIVAGLAWHWTDSCLLQNRANFGLNLFHRDSSCWQIDYLAFLVRTYFSSQCFASLQNLRCYLRKDSCLPSEVDIQKKNWSEFDLRILDWNWKNYISGRWDWETIRTVSYFKSQ